MGGSLYPHANVVSRHDRLDTLTLAESGSKLPAFKNLGRGVF
jgi:hypothetical protein